MATKFEKFDKWFAENYSSDDFESDDEFQDHRKACRRAFLAGVDAANA